MADCAPAAGQVAAAMRAAAPSRISSTETCFSASIQSGCITRDTMRNMTEVTIRELRNHGGEVVDRVAQGEQITITRGGRPVAELRPVSRQPLTAETLLTRWHRLPPVDYRAMRAEIDEVMDPAL